MKSFSIANLCNAVHADNWPDMIDSWRTDSEFEKLFGKTKPQSECDSWSPIKGLESYAILFSELSIIKKSMVGSKGPLYLGEYRGQKVVIKMMWPSDPAKIREEGSAKSCLESIVKEIAISSRLAHENVVRLVGACYNKPVYCLVMEQIQGSNLGEIIQKSKSPLPLKTVTSYALDIARGMVYLHSKGVVHHDLKPGNIIVQENGTSKSCLKIIDFGSSKLRHELSDCKTKEIGTYRWMAPEVMEHKKYDRRIDVYSFGMILWQLVSGEVPFADMTPMQAVLAILSRESRPNIPKSCPLRLSNLICRCWQTDPSLRPEFWEIVEILEKYDTLLNPKIRCVTPLVGFNLKSIFKVSLIRGSSLRKSSKIRCLSSNSLLQTKSLKKIN